MAFACAKSAAISSADKDLLGSSPAGSGACSVEFACAKSAAISSADNALFGSSFSPASKLSNDAFITSSVATVSSLF